MISHCSAAGSSLKLAHAEAIGTRYLLHFIGLSVALLWLCISGKRAVTIVDPFVTFVSSVRCRRAAAARHTGPARGQRGQAAMAPATQSVAQLAASCACAAASTSADSSQQSAAPAMDVAVTGFRVAAGSITSAQSADLAAGDRRGIPCTRWVLSSF